MPVEHVLQAVHQHTTTAEPVSMFHDYVAGRHRYPYASQAFITRARWILESARANLCPRVVGNFTDRVTLQTWEGAQADEAVELTTRRGLGKVLNLTVGESWTTGDGFVLAWPNRAGTMTPWFHRANQVAYDVDPEDPEAFAWVAKVWVSGRYGRVNVYYDTMVERWATTDPVRHDQASAPNWPDKATAYQPVTDDDGPSITYTSANMPTGIPWVHLPLDAAEQGGRGTSILSDVIPLQDALNHALVSSIVNVEQYAAPLRALLNHQPRVMIDPRTGEATEEAIRYDETRNRLLGVKGAGPLTQLDPPSSKNILDVMEAYGSWMARVVGVPASDIVPDLGNIPSGASLRTLVSSRTARVRDYTQDISPQVARLATLLGVPDVWPVWEDPTPTDDTERLDAALKRQDLGYTLQDNLIEAGHDPEQAKEIADNARAESANIGALAAAAFRAGQDPTQVL